MTKFVMNYVEAEALEEFAIPVHAEHTEIDYRERDNGEKYVRVTWLEPVNAEVVR